MASSSNRSASAVLPAARSSSARREAALALSQPLGRRRAGLPGVVLEQPQVADRLGDGLLGLGDVVGEVADQLVEHLLGILGAVEDGVDVGADQLADASEDRALCHRSCLPSIGRGRVDAIRYGARAPAAQSAAQGRHQRPPRAAPRHHRHRTRPCRTRRRRPSRRRAAQIREAAAAAAGPAPPHGEPPQPPPAAASGGPRR